MKTSFIILVALLLGIHSIIFAQNTIENEEYTLKHLITDINNNNFTSAVENITHVNNWELVPNSLIREDIDIRNIDAFLKYSKRKHIPKNLQDSLYRKISYYYAILGYYRSLKGSESQEWTDALHFAEKYLGRKDSLYWYLLDHQATIFGHTNDYIRVDSCMEIKLKYQKKVLGKTHPYCIETMQDLAWYNYLIYEQTNRFNSKLTYKALSKVWNYSMLASSAAWQQYGFKSIEHTKATQYDLMLDYITNNMTSLYFSYFMGLNDIYQIYHDSLQTNTEHHFDLLTLLISINFDSYNYTEALNYIHEMEYLANNNQSNQQLFLSNYYKGYYYQMIGNYKQAEEYYDKCISNYVNITRTPIIYVNPPEYNISRFFYDIGDYEKSEKFAHIVLKNIDMTVDYARMYMILGENAMARHQYNDAQRFIELSWSGFSRILNTKASKDIWSKLAKLAYLKGDCDSALIYWDPAIAQSIVNATRDTIYGEYGTDYYEIFIDGLYYAGCLGKGWSDDHIEKEFTIARSVYQKSYGADHNKYAELLYHYARWTNNLDSAVLAIQEYLDIYHDNFIKTTSFLSEKQRGKYWQTILPKLEDAPLLMWRLLETHPELLNTMYNNELFCKGALLKATNQIAQSIISSGDSALITDWERLTWLYENLEYQKNKTTSNVIQDMQKAAEQLEKKIVSSSSEYRKEQQQWKINVDSVKTYLPEDALAIEYLVIPEADKKWYCALLLRQKSLYPEVIVLFEEKEISPYLSSNNSNITNNTYDFYANGDTISQLVWSKILPKVKEGETIYFAPSGLLHQLAIEHLPYDETRTMADVFNMVRLSSTREIVINKPQSQYDSATIYGGIVYDADTDNMAVESREYPELAHRSIDNDTLNRGTVKYLPGTKKEAEHINTLLANHNISAKLYTTTKANEESFKALSGKHNNILHIGTHGFTWTDSVAKKQDFFTQRMQLMGREQHYDASIDPLNRCGLLFAGANIALQGNSKDLPKGVQDGILTAKEISLLDLRDADLVVLSACETAKGDITSEGVFGLQRAFKMAGVQTIIMSLWKVNDQATQLLMTEFYNNWIGKHQSKREAFRNAQNTVRTQYEEPEYWAGFIMLD